MKAIQQLFKYTLLAFLATVGILVGLGLLLSLTENLAMRKVQSVFGWNGVVFTGLIGTPIHETGHFLACKLFGLKVTEVSLFRPFAGRADGILGYVNYSYHTSNLWEILGCFFAGIAPMIFGAVVILLVVRFLTPEVFAAASKRLERKLKKTTNPLVLMGTTIGGYLYGFGSLRKFGIVRGLVSMYVICSISMHMDLSWADIKGAMVGILVVLAICVIYAAIALIARWNVERQLARTAALLAAFFSIGIVLCGVSWGAAALTELAARKLSGMI